LMEKREFAHLLSLNMSYRNSDYSTGNKTDSYGLGLDWAPVKEVKFRGSYQRAVRAANIIEMFQPQGLNLYNNDSDPCAGATPSATLAQCQKTGVTAAQYGRILDNPAGQYNYLQGGNPNLKPEKSDSYTLGLVLTPLKNLNATIDYFDMKVKDVIYLLDPVVTLQQCISTGDPTYCGLITRDSQVTLWANPAARIVGTNTNIGERKTSGIDLAANYSYKLDSYGSLTFNFMGTWIKKWETVQAPGISWDCVGYHGSTCGTPTPKWRHKVRATWATPWDADLALTWRHIDKVENQGLSSNPNLAGAVNDVDREMKAMDYLDVAASWAVSKQITLRAGVNNLLDKDPPVVNSTTLTSSFGNGKNQANLKIISERLRIHFSRLFPAIYFGMNMPMSQLLQESP
ncbi:MAG: TonB-dependent receptor, partial [Proteobacteria bacterium]|nr:TonB-dependent receptor [Pseudomonadota bacterium]